MALRQTTLLPLCAALCLSAQSSRAESHALEPEVRDLLNVSLTELLKRQDLTVTSVSRKAENLANAAAAVYVITAEDIRRAGVTSIPEALRLAPGVQVAQVGSNKWAISTRGFNDQLSNKLLVLMDGRTIYTPLFSGVNWDVQDMLIEDIDRIEIIRGPGATLWGANAVNGVINILTKSARATPATLVTGTIGNHEQGTAAARQGGSLSEDTFYRVYAKRFSRDEVRTVSDSDANDDWRSLRAGFRVDWERTADDRLTFQGDAYTIEEDRILTLPVLSAPYSAMATDEETRRGANLIGRWTHRFAVDSESVLQLYYDNVQRDNPSTLDQVRHTFDLDFQHSFRADARHAIVWGGGYRFHKDDLKDTIYLSYTPDSRYDALYSAFLQDTITLSPDSLYLTLGSKFEHNRATGFEFQPNARASWRIDEKQTLWGAVSRAVRTPNRSEEDVRLIAGMVPPNGLFTGSPAGYITQIGNRAYESEELTAYELGYRLLPAESIFIDTALFFNDYDNLRTLDRGTLFALPSVALPLHVSNRGSAESYGVEIAAEWQIMPGKWDLAAAYTFLMLDTDLERGSSDTVLATSEGKSPHHQVNIRSHLALPYQLEMDNLLYFTDNLPDADTRAYLRFDTRIGWEPVRGLDLSLVGQNLFDPYHKEFSAPLHSTAAEIPRSFFVKATYRF